VAGSGELNTIVRFHDIRRSRELERCILSLIGQRYRPLRIILALQRFSDQDVAATRALLAPMLKFADPPMLSIVNWEYDNPVDARSALMNLGLQAVQGRYVAFLDYDDVLYPEAYELVVSRMKQTGAAIAFAAVRLAKIDVYEEFSYTTCALPPFSGSNVVDLFRQNFCPIHSYIIDTAQDPKNVLSFEPTLTMEKDYDLLLRVCAAHQSDFSLVKSWPEAAS